MRKYFFWPVLLSLLSVLAYPHSGGLDSNGGHNDRKNGGYHYHRSPPAAVPPVNNLDSAAPAQENTHWITNKSGIRHNSGCRYYQNSQGRPCKKNDGRACKICGG